MRKLDKSKGERQTTLIGFRANYTLKDIANQCDVSTVAIHKAVKDINDGVRPSISLYVDKKDKIIYAFETDIRPVFGFK
ncbi:MAG: hypothetical protein JKY22_12215 [Flavobacteriaceae bacterium]|nr:hypothetical protein [Flavobacteriaceae bacterium]PCJ26515.1 MAG: hypothetical protein COA94_05250 [Rickettsiales bacterium]